MTIPGDSDEENADLRENDHEEEEEQEEEESEEADDIDWVRLPSNDLLSVSDADNLLRRNSADVIAIVGEHKSGKTTLISAIYERFLEGRFAGFAFVFSKSLAGFENRSFSSRAASGRPLPDTPRTSVQDGLRFFHLRLARDATPVAHVDLLLSERAGETYRAARDQPSKALNLAEVRKAKYVAFILDGEKVVDPLRRAEALAAVRGMIRAYSDANAIGANSQIQVVTTKLDLFEGESGVSARTALDAFEHNLSTLFSTRFQSLSFWRIAARDPNGKVDIAWGMTKLLNSWAVTELESARLPAALPELKTEFDRLLLRTHMEGV